MGFGCHYFECSYYTFIVNKFSIQCLNFSTSAWCFAVSSAKISRLSNSIALNTNGGHFIDLSNTSWPLKVCKSLCNCLCIIPTTLPAIKPASLDLPMSDWCAMQAKIKPWSCLWPTVDYVSILGPGLLGHFTYMHPQALHPLREKHEDTIWLCILVCLVLWSYKNGSPPV
jgi:hypothetical protein